MSNRGQPVGAAQAHNRNEFWLKGDHCDVVFTRRSETLLVTFDNLASIDERPGTRPWPAWLEHRAKALSYSILGLQTHEKDWFRQPETEKWLVDLQKAGFFKPFKHIVFIGTSMGGFAALCYAGLVPGARVLAFSPQSALNRQIAPFEQRYPYPFRKFNWDSPAYLDAAEHVDQIAGGHVFYDPNVAEDKQHAQRLRTPGLTDVAIPYAGHTLIRVLVKSGAFDHLLETYPATGQLDKRFFEHLKNKRANPKWARPFLNDLRKQRSTRCVRQICELFAKDYDLPYARRLLRQGKAVGVDALQPVDWAAPEMDIRKCIPVFVNSYNQLTYLRDTVDWFAKHGFGNVTVLDNKSNYPPLLDYFQSDEFGAKARLRALGENLGPRKALTLAAQDPAVDRGFIFTDPDLHLPDAPAPDMVKEMHRIGTQHQFAKVGLALSVDPEINDLDLVTYNTRTVGQIELKYWRDEVADQVFRATTDTTFFLYVPQEGGAKRFLDLGEKQPRIPSVRMGRPEFVAIHRPWMRNDTVDASETAYYFGSVSHHSTFVVAQKKVAAQQVASIPQWKVDRKMIETAIQALADGLNQNMTLIQIGAHDGKMADPVFPFIGRGTWCGMMVEPHPVYFTELQRRHSERPGLTLFNLAVSTEAGSFELFHMNETARSRYPRGIRGCASLDRDRMLDALRRGSRRKRIKVRDDDIASTIVQTQRLDVLLPQAGLDRADLLVIDVEGHEIAVLGSFDITRLDLKMAIVECNGQNAVEEQDIAKHLTHAGLTVFRVGEDLLGVHPNTMTTDLRAELAQAGFSAIVPAQVAEGKTP
jgi:FkbM family methyltransferase